MRVVLYATDEREEPENQLPPLRAWCAAGGYEIVEEYVDYGVAASILEAQPPVRWRFNALLNEAQQQRFDLVLCRSLGEFTREGLDGTLYVLQELESAGVGFHSYAEPGLATGKGLLAVMTALAAQERAWRSECTKIGMQRARERGRPIGRARIPAGKEAAIRAALGAGVGMIRIARQVRVAPATVHRIAHEPVEVDVPAKVSPEVSPVTGPVWR
jgi:DNA invertase Pin-like site-specific DNA recombinase